jgi:hypothetical protein
MGGHLPTSTFEAKEREKGKKSERIAQNQKKSSSNLKS